MHEIKERPIIFSGESVRAILDGRKMQTRRVIKPEWYRCLDPEDPEDVAKALAQSPYGQKGDSLWVKETFTYVTLAENELINTTGFQRRRPDGVPVLMIYRENSIAEGWEDQVTGRWNPSIFMPRWASRITLEIAGVRVERVRSISLDDIKAEGCTGAPLPGQMVSRNDGYQHYQEFRHLWDSINAKRGYGWDANPWVWVIEFSKPHPPAPA